MRTVETKPLENTKKLIGGLIFHNAEPLLAQADAEDAEKGWVWRVELIRSGAANSPVATLGSHSEYILSEQALKRSRKLFHNKPAYIHAGSQHEWSLNAYSEMARAGFYNNVKVKDGVMTADLHLADTDPGRHMRALLLLGWEKDNRGILEFSAVYQGKHDVETEQETDEDGYQYTKTRRYICKEITNVISVDVVRKGNYDTGALTMLQSLNEEAEMPEIIIKKGDKFFNAEDQEVDVNGKVIPQAEDTSPQADDNSPDISNLVTQAELQEFISRFDTLSDQNKDLREKIAAQEKLDTIRTLTQHARDKVAKVENFTDLERQSCLDIVTLGINEGILSTIEIIDEKIEAHIDVAAKRVEEEKKVEQTEVMLDERDKEALALQAYAQQADALESSKGIKVPAARSISEFLQKSGMDPYTGEGITKIFNELHRFHRFCVQNYTEDEMILRRGEWMDTIPELVSQAISGTTGWGATISTALFRAMAGHPETQRYRAWRKVTGRTKHAKAMGNNEFIVLGDYPRAITAKAESAAWGNPTSPASYTIVVPVKNYGYIEMVSLESMSRDMEGSLLQLIPRLYQAGELSIYTLVFARLRANTNISEDNTALFTTGHKNTKTEASTVTTRTTDLTLGNAKTAQAALLGVTPYGQTTDHDIYATDALVKNFIVPHDLYNEAEGIRNLQADGSNNANYNPFQRQDVETIIDLTATDADDWYVQADPRKIPLFCVAFWRGIDAPQIIPQTAATVGRQYTHDVTSYKMVFRCGVEIQNFRAIQRRQTS